MCHLTQFAMLAQQRPKAVIEITASPVSKLTLDARTSPTLAALRAAAGDTAVLPKENLVYIVITERPDAVPPVPLAQQLSVTLNGSKSFDPDSLDGTNGLVEQYVWDVQVGVAGVSMFVNHVSVPLVRAIMTTDTSRATWLAVVL